MMITVPDPLRVGDHTYLVRPLVGAPGAPLQVHMSSLVILGAEPVIVDTGAALLREAWTEQVFGLVEPADVRWIFLSHDDGDHTGNLAVALEMCPQATLVTTWFASARMSAGLDLALDRQRWIGDGESFDAGDRRLVAVRPPVFDAPTTRGLFDTSTGVYWSSDAFGTPVPDVVDDVACLPADLWHDAQQAFSSMLSPWHTMVDPVRFGAQVDRVADLRPSTIVGAHGPMLTGASIDTALARLRELPATPPFQLPGQPVLDELLAAV